MKSVIKKLSTATALSGLLLVSAGAWAGGHAGGHNPERMLQHMTEKLELDDTQQDQVEGIVSENLASVQADRERMTAIRDQLKGMRESFDADKAKRLADELGEITGRLAYDMASTQAQVYEVLTPVQREQMDAMQAAREQRMQKRRPGRD